MTKKIKEILKLIDSFEIKRAKDIEKKVLDSIEAPIINNKKQDGIINSFKDFLEDDRNGCLASFVVMSPTNVPLVFYSLRCGELFEKTQIELLEKICKIHNRIHELANNNYSQKDLDELSSEIKEAGLSIDDILILDDEKTKKKIEYKIQNFYSDKNIDKNEEINQVSESYPAIELKLFGANYSESAKKYWKSLDLPIEKVMGIEKEMKMGETLFWLKIVKTIEEITKYVGCQYVYLFAADKESDGELVQYYKGRLKFESSTNLSANKPSFDWTCQFLYESIDKLFEEKERFIKQVTQLFEKQMIEAQENAKIKCVDDLLNSGETWEVE